MAVTNKTFADLITFTRSGATATRVNSAGLIETVAADTPRFDYDPVTGAAKGLLIEEARTNLLSRSEEFDNASWPKTGSSVTPNAVTAPDGTATADHLIEDTSTGEHRVQRNITTVASTTYAGSVFVKSDGSGRLVRVIGFQAVSPFGTAFNVTVNPADGSIVNGTGTVEDYGNGWYRVSGTGAAVDTTTAIRVALATTGPTYSYTGDGTSGIYIWGAQIEAGAFPSSYIPTPSTFTSRASTATYFDSEGVLQTAAINEARTGYKLINGTWTSMGLLLEAAATNLLLRSEEFDNAYWTQVRSSVTANATTAPDGTVTADKLVEDSTATDEHYVRRLLTVSASTDYTVSGFFKAAERSWIVLGYNAGGGSDATDGVYFNLTNGTVGSVGSSITSYGIEAAGNGWYRCWVKGQVPAAGTTWNADFAMSDGDGNVRYTGDGSSGLYIWGAQLEAGTYPTSYIPTTTATVTRSADVSSSSTVTRPADKASITGTNFSDWYNASEGTVYVEAASALSEDAPGGYMFSLSDGTNSNRMLSINATAFHFYVETLDSQVVSLDGGTPTNNTFSKFAGAFKANDFALCLDGGTVQTDTSGGVPVVDRLIIGSNATGSGVYLNGHIKDLRFYPTRLSNAELQELTS